MEALDRPFLISSDADPLLSYGQLEAWAEMVAWSLRRNGVGPGDVVAVDLPNSPAFAAVLCATWNVGAVFAPLDSWSSARQKQQMISLAAPQVVVATTRTPTGTPTLLWRDPFEAPTDIDWIPSTFESGAGKYPTLAIDRLILFTSGSTGQPKAVVLSKSGVAAAIAAIADHFAITAADRTVALLPWSQGHGLFTTLLAGRQTRSTVVLPASGEVTRSQRLLDRARPTWLTTVPAQLAVLTAGLTPASKNLHSMRFLRSASAPLPRLLAERAERLLGCPVVEALELTEAGHQAAADQPCWDRVPGTVGAPTGLEFRLAGAQVAGGQELEVRGTALFSRYLGNPVATAASFTRDGWWRTGDVARREHGGGLRILGRVSEIVHRGEHSVAPVDVETVLGEHPDVMSSLATRVPHPELVDDIAAVVRLRRGSHTTQRDLLKHCRARLVEYQVPGQIRIVEDLPQLPNGKPSRRMAAQLF